MAKPSARQMKEFWDQVDRGLITSMHVQYLLDGRVDPHNVIVRVNYDDQRNRVYAHLGVEQFWCRASGVQKAKLGFIVLVQDTSLRLAYEMLSYQAGHSAPDLAESSTFFREHPEMVEDAAIAALCGKPEMDVAGTIPGMVVIEASKSKMVKNRWHLDSYVLKEGTRLLVAHI